MKKVMFESCCFCYFFICGFMLFSTHADAYIDPSTVTYIIQGVAGVLIAIGAAFTIFRHKIKAAWRKWYYGRKAEKLKKQQVKQEKKEEK